MIPPRALGLAPQACQFFCHLQRSVANHADKQNLVLRRRGMGLRIRPCHVLVREKTRANPHVITVALDLYFKDGSLREIVDHLKQFERV